MTRVKLKGIKCKEDKDGNESFLVEFTVVEKNYEKAVETSNMGLIMSNFKIYDFAYECVKCKGQFSISQSSPLQENQILHCSKCGAEQRVTYMHFEPEVKTVIIREVKYE